MFVRISPVLKQREGARKERARTEIIMSQLPSSVPVRQNSSPSCPRKCAFYKLVAFALRAKCRRVARFYKRENINVSFPSAACLRYESVTTTTTATTTFNLSQTAEIILP